MVVSKEDTLFKEQLEWEEECVARGSERYFNVQEKNKAKGNDLTDSTRYILKERLLLISDLIKEDCKFGKRGQNAMYNKIVRTLAGEEEDYVKLAYIGIKALLIQISQAKIVKLNTFTHILGKNLEIELKCALFKSEKAGYYYTVLKSFDDNDVSSLTHKQNVMMKKFNDFEFEWNPWNEHTRVHVGMRILRNILKGMDDLIFIRKSRRGIKTMYDLDTTEAFDTWIKEFEKERGLLLPMLLPLKCPPNPWTEDNNKKGYYTPRMAIPFIKTRGRTANKFIKDNIPMQHKQAINKMQDTPWKINQEVLKVQEQVFKQDLRIGLPSIAPIVEMPFPQHLCNIERKLFTEHQLRDLKDWKAIRKQQYLSDRKRKGQVLGFRQSFLLAQDLSTWDKFYFAFNCDFRGRVYCSTTGLSPQGADTAKGVLHFAEGVKLGTEGIKWLAIQGANVFGVDKVSYEDRIKWVKENELLIKAIVEDPLSNTQWGDADKPYQFLAFCFEWAKSNYGRNPSTISHLPVGLDGSCNGLQHFSAMLKDEVGAKATNLINNDLPQDIYQEVADLTTKKCQLIIDNPDSLPHKVAYAKLWVYAGITRKCTKRPVMTICYGATQQSARNYILEYVVENWDKFHIDVKQPSLEQTELVKFLTPVLWEAMNETVIAARAAMDWLKKNVGNDFCKWITPIGFPVYQFYAEEETIRIVLELDGTYDLHLLLDDSDVCNNTQQHSGIAPNFVHSIDSTHMIMTINNTDLKAYAMIHDDYGTHAGNTECLFKAIRTSFLELYTKHSPLKEWAEQQLLDEEVFEELPIGEYDIKDIVEAKYFFG